MHDWVGNAGKDLLRALHGAPEDMASWLDPARVEDNGLESAKDDKFKSLREELVTALAERSVSYISRSSARRCPGCCEGRPIKLGNIWRLKNRVYCRVGGLIMSVMTVVV